MLFSLEKTKEVKIVAKAKNNKEKLAGSKSAISKLKTSKSEN